MARNRVSAENAYKNQLANLDDTDVSDARDGSLLSMTGSPAALAVPGLVITVSESEPTVNDGEDGDIWFVVSP